jgi:Mg2+ and Co2+ transporter CorA
MEAATFHAAVEALSRCVIGQAGAVQSSTTRIDDRVAVTARRYVEGATEAERVELVPDGAASLDDRQLLWVDVDDAKSAVDVVQLLGFPDAVATMPVEEGIRFRDRFIRLAVTGLLDLPGDPKPIIVHLVVGRNVVVSLHDGPVRGLEDPIEEIAGDPRFGRLSGGVFLGLLLEGMLAGYRAEVERIEQVIDDLDEQALRERRPTELLDALVHLRHQVALLRRGLSGQQPVFSSLVRPIEGERKNPVGQPGPELLERLERLLQTVDQLREQLVGSFDIIQGRTAQHTNDVVRVLTVISGVLLPSVVVAGVMGMNFEVGLFDDPANFFVVIGAMALLAGGILVVARIRGWL